ncbi:MAG TPA: ion transporter [Blastocatellia bacterium]|nr:ion transporter [Blastocatellia bacterium]
MNLKKRVWEILEVDRPDDERGRVFDAFDIFILTLILLNVAAVILGTVKSVEARFETALHRFEVFSVAVFTIEYLARLWACVSQSKYSRPVVGRLRFMLRPIAIIDLLAILPFYLSFFTADLRFMRALRLFRLFRVAKLGRYSTSVQLFGSVFKNKKEELVVTMVMMLLLIMMSASCMYFAENEAQPDKFSDIPSTVWWAVMTLTTVGYGDIFPITPLGKFLTMVIAILGIGMFALPVGIFGAGFVEEIQKRKAGKSICPHCGEVIE